MLQHFMRTIELVITIEIGVELFYVVLSLLSGTGTGYLRSFYALYVKFLLLEVIQFFSLDTLCMCLAINSQPDFGWMRRLQQILGRKHQRNLHVCTTELLVLIRNTIFAI